VFRGVGLLVKITSSKFIKFVEACQRQASSLPEYSSKFSRKDFTLRQHFVLLCMKVKTKQRYREFCEIVDLMPEIKRILDLSKIPHWTTLDKAFLRIKNTVLAALLQAKCSFASIDATGFDRRHASKQYLNRCGMHIKSLKATFLINVENQEICGIHSTTTRKHDSKIVLPLTKHRRLRVLCADMGYDDSKVRRTLRMRGTRPLIPHREFKRKHEYMNSLIDKRLYGKRSLSETVFSAIKRKYSDTLYSKHWRSQRKELTLLAVVHNADRKAREAMVFLVGFLQSHSFHFPRRPHRAAEEGASRRAS
jgi:IS5 family transposase